MPVTPESLAADPLQAVQLIARAQEAADRIEALQADLLEARQALAGAVQGFYLQLVDTAWGKTHAGAITKVQSEYAAGMPMPVSALDEIAQLRDLLGEVANGERPEMGWDDWHRRVKAALGR